VGGSAEGLLGVHGEEERTAAGTTRHVRQRPSRRMGSSTRSIVGKEQRVS
jgi:hypothetical protein